MPFDFRKEYKEFYLSKNTPEIVAVPRANYITAAVSCGRMIDWAKKHPGCFIAGIR